MMSGRLNRNSGVVFRSKSKSITSENYQATADSSGDDLPPICRRLIKRGCSGFYCSSVIADCEGVVMVGIATIGAGRWRGHAGLADLPQSFEGSVQECN